MLYLGLEVLGSGGVKIVMFERIGGEGVFRGELGFN